MELHHRSPPTTTQVVTLIYLRILSKKRIEEDHLRRVSFGVNIVFRCRSSQKNPKGLKDQRWTGVESIPSGELSFKTETQTDSNQVLTPERFFEAQLTHQCRSRASQDQLSSS